MFLEVKQMRPVVKYDVYLDILLVGAIYVTTYLFLKETLQSLSSCEPRHPGLGTSMLYGTICENDAWNVWIHI